MKSIPAASLIVWCDEAQPSVLMVERSRRMAFAAGAMVFPGGKLDASDWNGELRGYDAIEMASRIAAIRETIEETGIVVGVEPMPDQTTSAAWRRMLLEGASLTAIFATGKYRLALDNLIPFARWHPPERGGEARIFDTRFYLVRAEKDQVPTADGCENVRADWLAPSIVLAEADREKRRIIFPTRRNLERLAQFSNFEAARADATLYPVQMIQPWIEERPDGSWMCIPEGMGYSITQQRLDGMTRG